MRIFSIVAALALMPYFPASSASDINVRVVGLFTNKVLLKIEGEQKLVAKGETFKGVTLISASARGAVVTIHGETKKLGLNQSIGSNYKKPEFAKSRIYADEQGMYYINDAFSG